MLLLSKTANATLYQIESRDSFSTSASTTHYNIEFYSSLAGQFNGFLINNYSEKNLAGAKDLSFSVLDFELIDTALQIHAFNNVIKNAIFEDIL